MRREQLFEKEEDFKKACMKPAELERRQKAIDAYEEELRRSCQEVEWLRSQLKEKEAPDLEQTEKELKEQKEQQRLKERELRKLYSRRETNQQANRRLQQLTKEREELRKRYQVLNTLSRTANGSLTGTAKIDLESYMQRQYFQHMIRCANRHLERMAAGQFLLKCRSMENLSTQGNTGLDLDVYSLITGKVRDVKTLSGGESFMAALALALGMTDIHQTVLQFHQITFHLVQKIRRLFFPVSSPLLRLYQVPFNHIIPVFTVRHHIFEFPVSKEIKTHFLNIFFSQFR